ncbi:MAG: DUF2306 domain-containing protein [Calditrichia bacterium]
MDFFVQWTLYTHIAAGFIALVVAPIAMLTQKGGEQHRRWGKVYFYGMAMVTVTAIIVSLYRPIPFLLMVAVFSFYTIVSAYRILYLKKLHKGQKPKRLDWIIATIAGAFNIGLLGWGIQIITSSENNFGIVAIVFGLVGIAGVVQNTWAFFKPPTAANHWLLNHMSGMLGGYIATVTAFSAVNLHFMPTVLQWLWPTLIGAPLISYWRRQYQTKKKVAVEG